MAAVRSEQARLPLSTVAASYPWLNGSVHYMDGLEVEWDHLRVQLWHVAIDPSAPPVKLGWQALRHAWSEIHHQRRRAVDRPWYPLQNEVLEDLDQAIARGFRRIEHRWSADYWKFGVPWRKAEAPWRVRLPEPSSSTGYWIYFVQAGRQGPIKIGVSKRPIQRLYDLRTNAMALPRIALATPLRLLTAIEGDYKAERRMHQRFSEFRLTGEWFAPEARLLDFIGEVRHAAA